MMERLWAVLDTSNSELSDNLVFSIAVDKYNNKWISTYRGGINIYNEDGIQNILK